ncbi:hypothetical protein DFH06DRAFT_1300158 [Mycena polygramma]|nr:hypothetical protein DFH06DRAFT_1300158 [Mycena polygramma]
MWIQSEPDNLGNDAAAAGSRAAVLVERREVCVLLADDATAAGARAAVVVDGREENLLGLGGDGGGESVHYNLGGWVWMNREVWIARGGVCRRRSDLIWEKRSTKDLWSDAAQDSGTLILSTAFQHDSEYKEGKRPALLTHGYLRVYDMRGPDITLSVGKRAQSRNTDQGPAHRSLVYRIFSQDIAMADREGIVTRRNSWTVMPEWRAKERILTEEGMRQAGESARGEKDLRKININP